MNFDDHVPDEQLHTMLGPLGDALAEVGLAGAKKLMDRAAARLARFERQQAEINRMVHIVVPRPETRSHVQFQHECDYFYIPEEERRIRYDEVNLAPREPSRVQYQNVRHRLHGLAHITTIQLALAGNHADLAQIQNNHHPGFRREWHGDGRVIFGLSDLHLTLEET